MKRMREHAALFGALLGVVALVSGLSVGVVGFLAQSANEGIRSGLASRAGSDLALRASLALDPDAEKQDAEVRAAIVRTFPGVDIAVDRTIGARVEIDHLVDGVSVRSVRGSALSIPDLPDRATLVDGTWPDSPDQVTIQADGAAHLDLAVGDQLEVGDALVTISGTWRVNDGLDPRWLGETLLTSGVDPPDYGPVVIDESLWAQTGSDPRVRWTLVPDGSTLTSGELVDIVDEWNSLGTEWRGQVTTQLTTLEKLGRFKRTALELGSRVDGLQAIQPVMLLLLAAIALVTLAELGRLLTTTRGSELALLWSRGASALEIGRSTAAEVAVAAAAGAVLGAGTALGALALLLTPEAIGAAGAAVWVLPLVVALAAVLVVAGSAFRSALRQTVRDPSEAAGRARRLAGPGAVILTAGAAALSVWQLQLYGSPLTPTEDGGTDVDPIAVVAPALVLVAVVLVALVLFPRIAALDERVTKRAGIARTLAARTVARRLQIVAAPIVVMAVAASTLVVAAGYSATWSDSFDRTTQLRAGAPLHVSTGPPGVSSSIIEGMMTTEGVDGVAPVDMETLQLGGETGSIVAATPGAIANIATTASGVFDRDAAASTVAMDLPGPDVPEGTTSLTLTTAQEGFAVTPDVAIELMDGNGVLRRLTFDAPQDLGEDDALVIDGVPFHRFSYPLTLPQEVLSSPAPWHVLTIDIDIPQKAVTGDALGQFTLQTFESDAGEIELDPFWMPESPSLPFEGPNSNYAGKGFSINGNALSVRMTPTFDQLPSDHSTPPVVISQRMADLYDLAPGKIVTFTLEDAFDRTNAVVKAVVPAIPGARQETALMMDIGYVLHWRLRFQEVPTRPRDFWIDTAAPDATAAALRPVLPANTQLQSADDPTGRAVLGSAALALWFGAIGCLVLAIITVVAVIRAQLRSRRLDVVVLRAIGFSSRDQAGVRRRELALVLGYGGLTGLLCGFAVCLLTIPQLARAAVVDPYPTVPTPLGFDWIGLGAGAVALTAALLIVVAVYASRVAKQARTAIGAEEVL